MVVVDEVAGTVDVVVDEVVVEVAGRPVVVVAGRTVDVVVDTVVAVRLEKTSPTLVLLAGAGPPLTTVLSGLPTASSTTVTTESAKTKTRPITAMTGQRTPRGDAGGSGATGGGAAMAGPSRLQSDADSTGAPSVGGAGGALG